MKKEFNLIKEQTIYIEVQINEEEIGKVLEKEFRKMIIKMIKNLEKKWRKHKNQFNKDLLPVESHGWRSLEGYSPWGH